MMMRLQTDQRRAQQIQNQFFKMMTNRMDEFGIVASDFKLSLAYFLVLLTFLVKIRMHSHDQNSRKITELVLTQ